LPNITLRKNRQNFFELFYIIWLLRVASLLSGIQATCRQYGDYVPQCCSCQRVCVCVIMAATCGNYLQQLVAVTVVWCNFFYSLIPEHLESTNLCQGGPSPDADQESGSR